MILVLRCPKCGNKMKYATSGGLEGKRKRCVYCGKSFAVRGRIAK
jgi:hypothetical protein